jgi:hypothetical protein
MLMPEHIGDDVADNWAESLDELALSQLGQDQLGQDQLALN